MSLFQWKAVVNTCMVGYKVANLFAICKSHSLRMTEVMTKIIHSLWMTKVMRNKWKVIDCHLCGSIISRSVAMRNVDAYSHPVMLIRMVWAHNLLQWKAWESAAQGCAVANNIYKLVVSQLRICRPPPPQKWLKFRI